MRCLFLSGAITLFANLPDVLELPGEKIGFGALLFFIIWTYMRHVLPKTQAEMERKNNRIAELIEEVRHLNTLREKDHQTIVSLLKDARQKGEQP
ncbi:MAG: hypothetical protein FWD31_12660 [Planctomycetaceae bacterium]|nr:hypothetical protein [Planctomycetaceae bacterium]